MTTNTFLIFLRLKWEETFVAFWNHFKIPSNYLFYLIVSFLFGIPVVALHITNPTTMIVNFWVNFAGFYVLYLIIALSALLVMIILSTLCCELFKWLKSNWEEASDISKARKQSMEK